MVLREFYGPFSNEQMLVVSYYELKCLGGFDY
jgi:hypothetical protein